MRSLKILCEDSGFPEAQKEYFRTEVGTLLAEGGIGEEGALFCLRRLWQYYDVGGHSVGRSLRSVILDKVMDWLCEGGEVDVQKAKTLLMVLVAMHYDYEYINRHQWFDFHLVAMWELPLRDRVLVSTAAFALDVDDVPQLDEWSKERIFAFV